jgi:serine-type D-Ala-D-Ala carboxypeptidase/endopeptidase (penicillin-binding protein 4)
VAVLQADASSDHSDLRSVVTSLPVAGFSGSLDDRFVDSAPSGLGLVTAKTGTLTGVHALAGVVSTRSGAVLVFAAVADQVPVPKTFAARAQLDRIGAALAGCGC